MVVSLDPQAGTATLFSVPRDLYVFIPGWRMERVNTADPHGGFDVAAQTILYNFGIPVHNYARMNFAGFMNLIDSLGGISVEVTDYLNDQCGGIWYSYGPGSYNMDGFTALCYVRMRYGSSDFDRLRRQQEVLQAIFRKVLTLDGLRRVPDLYEQYRSIVETDISLTEALALIPLAAQLAEDGSRISRLTIDPTMAAAWRVPYTGAAVLLPDRIKIDAMLRIKFGS
jgi:LCP family protein required for cell wall assembly